MSRLSDILGVKEGQEFRFGELKGTFKINGDRRMYKSFDGEWYETSSEYTLSQMIAHPENIQPITNLTEQQITAIKGRIAEGTPWAARDKDAYSHIYFYTDKPKLSHDKVEYVCSNDKEFNRYSNSINSDLYDFITFENSPVYLPELIEGSEK